MILNLFYKVYKYFFFYKREYHSKDLQFGKKIENS